MLIYCYVFIKVCFAVILPSVRIIFQIFTSAAFPWGLALLFIKTFSPTILIFTYLDNVLPSNSGGGIDGKSQVNNLMKS